MFLLHLLVALFEAFSLELVGVQEAVDLLGDGQTVVVDLLELCGVLNLPGVDFDVSKFVQELLQLLHSVLGELLHPGEVRGVYSVDFDTLVGEAHL